jgi:hypothetical protein
MNGRTCWTMIFAGWIAVGCQSIHVKTQSDHQIAFADLHTFCWVPAPAWLHNDPRLHIDLVEPLVQHDVEAELSARGLRQVDCTSADVQVTFTAALQETFSDRAGAAQSAVYEYAPGSGGEWFTSTPEMMATYKRVPSLVILVRRPGSDRVVWQGRASANMPQAVNEAQIAQRIRTAVHLIMHQFPVPERK